MSLCPTCKAQEETYDQLWQCCHPSHVGWKSALLHTDLLKYTQETHCHVIMQDISNHWDPSLDSPTALSSPSFPSSLAWVHHKSIQHRYQTTALRKILYQVDSISSSTPPTEPLDTL
jgi:hypothetical protein